MVLTPEGLLEYLLTIGISVAFFGLLVSVIAGRSEIYRELRSFKINRKHILIAVLIVLLFLFIEFYVVQPTQMLYFDDDIYQAGALDLLHTGQAWQCNYGTPTACYIGVIFLEPVGESLNLAVGFLFFGVSRDVAYGTQIAVSSIGIFVLFFAALLLFKNLRAAFFSELLIALSPAVLMWARPTTSDLPSMVYSIIALFFLLLFLRRKNLKTFSMLAFSIALATYMKVDDLALLVIFLIGYFILDYKSMLKTIIESGKLVKSAMANASVVIIVVLFIVSVVPEMLYAQNESINGGYLYYGSVVPNTCGSSPQYLNANATTLLEYLPYNICANALFWFGTYNSQYVIQPLLFTVLALAGAVLMIISKKRKELYFIAIWFFTFFFIYVLFYAGSVLFGINWRFQLDMIPQASLLGGFCCAFFVDKAAKLGGELARHARQKRAPILLTSIACIVFLAIIFYSSYSLIPYIGVSVANLPQAGNARFYENFVLSQGNEIPSNCAVFSYDPTLFFLVNRSSLQTFYLYNSTIYQNVSQRFSCKVLDYGYWCYTPNNICPSLTNSSQYTFKPIVTATDVQFNQTFGFYYILNKST